MNARTDTGLSEALDCSPGTFEENGIPFEPHGELLEIGTARNYVRDAAWAGTQWR